MKHLPSLVKMSKADMQERRRLHRVEGISGRSLFLDIVARSTGECIGTTGFRSISEGRAEWGCILHSRWHHLGLCAEAFAASIKHAATLHIKTVTAQTAEINVPMCKALSKFGMQQTRHCPQDGTIQFEGQVATLLTTISALGGSSSLSRQHAFGWQYALFGVAEPAVNIATTLLITGDSSLFVQLLFANAAATAPLDGMGELAPTLARMYASVLLCFGLTQAVLWREWRLQPSESAQRAVRTWMWAMLLPDCHHLLMAYGPYVLGPHGRLDVAFVAHYAIQGLLTIFRIAHLLGVASPRGVRCKQE